MGSLALVEAFLLFPASCMLRRLYPEETSKIGTTPVSDLEIKHTNFSIHWRGGEKDRIRSNDTTRSLEQCANVCRENMRLLTELARTIQKDMLVPVVEKHQQHRHSSPHLHSSLLSTIEE